MAKAAAGGPWDAANGHGEDVFRSVLARAGMHLPAVDARVCCDPGASASSGEFLSRPLCELCFFDSATLDCRLHCSAPMSSMLQHC